MQNTSKAIKKILKVLPAAIWTAAGMAFLWMVFSAGLDEIYSLRDLLTGAVIALAGGSISFCLYFRLFRENGRGLLWTAAAALLLSFMVSVKAPELMRIPLSLPAENGFRIQSMDPDTRLDVSWTYWFRPRDLNHDPFLWDADADIAFSRWQRTGAWINTETEDGPILSTADPAAELLLPKGFRSHLAVVCLRVNGGSAVILPAGSADPIQLTPEDTDGQPMRLILRGGMLPFSAAFLVQWMLWGGVLLLPLSALSAAALLLRRKKSEVLFYAAAFLIPCAAVLFLCLLLRVCPFGEKTFLYNDMWGEYADYMAYFRTILSGENSLFYSFSKSIGDGISVMLAFYVNNPLNLLVCLFPLKNLPQAVSLLVILRYGISGLTAALYFRKGRKMGKAALLFSTAYALMAFQFVNAENTNLREAPLLLPLVILGLERMLDGDSSRLFCWTLAGTIWLNFYSAYQVCVFCALYFIAYCCLHPEGPALKIRLSRFLKSALIAVGCMAFFLLPVVLQLRGGPKTFDLSRLTPDLKMDWLELGGKLFNSAFDKEQIESHGLPNIYCGMTVLPLAMLFFFSRSISRREKWTALGMLAMLTALMQVTALDLIMHGLNNPGWWNYRHSFYACFFIIQLAARAWQERDNLPPFAAPLTAALLCLLGLFCRHAEFSWLRTADAEMNIVLAAFFTLLLTRRDTMRGWLPCLLSVLSTLELGVNGYHILQISTTFERTNTVSNYRAYYEPNQALINEIKAQDDGFYRIAKSYWRDANDAFLLNYNGIEHYSSTLKHSVMDFLPRVGYRYFPYRFFYQEGSTTAMDSLLGIKYLITQSGSSAKGYIPVFNDGERFVYQNPYALPLAFNAAPAALAEEDRSEGFPLQNHLFTALSGTGEEIFNPAEVVKFEASGMTAEKQGTDICYTKGESGFLEWTLRIDRNEPLYAFFPAENIHISQLSIGAERTIQYFDNFSYHIHPLGVFDPGTELTLRMTPYEDTVCLRDAQFYYEDRDALAAAYDALIAEPAEITRVSGSRLHAETQTAEDRLLVLTIPYDKSWRIRLNGEQVESQPVFGVFTGIPLPAGEHTLDFQYIPEGLIPGSVISLCVLGIVLGDQLRKKRRESKEPA